MPPTGTTGTGTTGTGTTGTGTTGTGTTGTGTTGTGTTGTGTTGISPGGNIGGPAFETVQGFTDRYTGVQLVAHLPNVAAEIASEKLPAKQGFIAHLYWIGRMDGHKENTAGVRLIWGETWSIAMRESKDQKITFTLEKWGRVREKPKDKSKKDETPEGGDTGSDEGGPDDGTTTPITPPPKSPTEPATPTGKPKAPTMGWNVVSRFDGVAREKWEGKTRISIERIAGRLVITIGAHKFDFLNSSPSKTEPGTGRVSEATWQSAPLRLSLFGVKAKLGVLLYSYKRDGKPLQGSFSRLVKRKLPPGDYTFEGKALGWGGKQFKREVEGTVTREGIRYVCTLRADPLGLESPAVSLVLGRAQGTHETPTQTPLDITSAFLSGTMDEASPEAGEHGVQMTLKISRNILRDLAQNRGLVWQDYVKQFGAVTFEARYQLTGDALSSAQTPEQTQAAPNGAANGANGVTTGEQPGVEAGFTPWIGRFFYVMDEGLSTSSPNAWDGSLTLQDPTARLVKPHSTIDHRFIRDLAYLLSLKNEQLGGSLYGGDCVKYLLSVELGEQAADALNGNGNPRRFFSEDYPPLLTNASDTIGLVYGLKPPTQSEEILPVQWGAGVMDEIKRISTKEFACFFYEHIEGEDEQGQFQGMPVPVYADYRQWVANAPTWDLFDSTDYDDFSPGDMDFLIQAIELSRRGSNAYNRVLVWDNPPGSPGNLPFPASLMAESRLPEDDPNSIENTGWARTFVKSDSGLGMMPGANAAFAAHYLARLKGVPIEWPKVTLRGDMRLKWGHKVTLHMSAQGEGARFSDVGMKLDGRTFRILKVNHEFSKEKMGPDSFKTRLSLFPILTGEV